MASERFRLASRDRRVRARRPSLFSFFFYDADAFERAFDWNGFRLETSSPALFEPNTRAFPAALCFASRRRACFETRPRSYSSSISSYARRRFDESDAFGSSTTRRRFGTAFSFERTRASRGRSCSR